MLFNSYEFIFLFLPITLLVYLALSKGNLLLTAKVFLVTASLFFYAWWNPIYLPLILCSIIFNYLIGTLLARKREKFSHSNRKIVFAAGIFGNLALLGYYKYADFFIANVNYISGFNISPRHIILPLAISFFTFQQIAYLFDTYRGECKEYSLLNYTLFVSFFPQLIAGPIVHHKEVIPQFEDSKNRLINFENLSAGVFLFFIGLFKKVVLADTFSILANNGFDKMSVLTFIEAWATSLSYTLQLYFDFSGYTDMALGAALMFNIKLPTNFNSPYKSLNIQDFWRRWHITLNRFMSNYVYIPMGGNRISLPRTLLNLMVTFLIGGLWHGAGWTFVFWGFLHGIAIAIHRIWRRFNINMPKFLAWFLTFNFVNIAWVFFRSRNFNDAFKVLKGMLGMSGVILPGMLASKLAFLRQYGIDFRGLWMMNMANGERLTIITFAFLLIVLLFKNSNQMIDSLKPTWKNFAFIMAIAIVSIFSMGRIQEFIYFNF